jgi:hypothetical protein
MCCAHHGTVFRRERNHLTIACRLRLTIMRRADYKKWAGTIGTVPASPRPFGLAKATLDPHTVHDRGVEVQATVKVRHAYKNV